MSGGHFNYDQYKIGQIADEVEDLIYHNGNQENDEWGQRKGQGFTTETIAEFRKGLAILRQAQVYAQRIDWLVSCDDSEDSFHERLEIDLAKLKETPMSESRDCKHGQLARSCNVCELEAEVARLASENERLLAAAKLALEALSNSSADWVHQQPTHEEAIAALKEVIHG